MSTKFIFSFLLLLTISSFYLIFTFNTRLPLPASLSPSNLFDLQPLFKIIKEKNSVRHEAVKKSSEEKLDIKIYSSRDQEDEEVINFIRKNHIISPSKLPYNLTNPGKYHSNGLSSIIYNIFNKNDGTFVEVGAHDGESASNSLFLEEIGWKGLLIECNPLLVPQLKTKQRKAWVSDVCLSTSASPQIVNFTTPIEWPASAKLGRPLNETEMKNIGIDWMSNKTWLHYELPAFPLYSIMRAASMGPLVDFLSLDVEGAEMQILTSFPFHKMKFKAILVEVILYSAREKRMLGRHLKRNGYNTFKNLGNDYLFMLDKLYVT